jgi:hypothetical protein
LIERPIPRLDSIVPTPQPSQGNSSLFPQIWTGQSRIFCLIDGYDRRK